MATNPRRSRSSGRLWPAGGSASRPKWTESSAAPRKSKDQTFAFDGEKFVQEDAATGDEFAGAYQLDLSGKRKVFAAKVTVGTREVTIRYIYELDGDTLKVCGHLLPGKELPTEFSAPEGSKRMFAVFKRAKK